MASRNATHSNPGWDKIDLVENVDEMFVCLLFSEVLDNRLTPGTYGISGVQNMDDNV